MPPQPTRLTVDVAQRAEDAGCRFRKDLHARLQKLLPLVLLMLAALVIAHAVGSTRWFIAPLVAALCAIACVCVLRGRFAPAVVLALAIVASYCVMLRAVPAVDLTTAGALAAALVLVVVQLAWDGRPAWLANTIWFASYASGGALLYSLADGWSRSTYGADLVCWMFLAAAFAALALTVSRKSERALQQAARATASEGSLTPDDRILALEDENRALAAAKRDLESFVYAISHDLRAPLRAIDGFASLLPEDVGTTLSARAQRDVAGIRSGVERMHELLTCWLAIARCEHAEARCEQVDVSELAETLLKELRLSEPHRLVDAQIATGVIAYADPVLCRELLQNLLANAWKFTEGSDRRAAIEVGVSEEHGETTYFVRDNGVGFDPAERHALFRPFQRLRAAARYSGTGLGLAIAQRIVERHGGRIWADGVPDHGATFWFTLPRAGH
jgi:signal transduction histidine kinase